MLIPDVNRCAKNFAVFLNLAVSSRCACERRPKAKRLAAKTSWPWLRRTGEKQRLIIDNNVTYKGILALECLLKTLAIGRTKLRETFRLKREETLEGPFHSAAVDQHHRHFHFQILLQQHKQSIRQCRPIRPSKEPRELQTNKTTQGETASDTRCSAVTYLNVHL